MSEIWAEVRLVETQQSQIRHQRPVLEAALARDQLQGKLETGGAEREQLQLHYPAIKHGTGYVPPVITLEFGGRATGEPHPVLPVTCDMDGHVEGIVFPVAYPVVMSVARTFWEKATAAHVYCAQGASATTAMHGTGMTWRR